MDSKSRMRHTLIGRAIGLRARLPWCARSFGGNNSPRTLRRSRACRNGSRRWRCELNAVVKLHGTAQRGLVPLQSGRERSLCINEKQRIVI